MRSPADASFARFQRTRDPVALAAVFDATAPGLLLVAMHLCGDAADAEDLVQTVFLQAIRDAGSYDAGQPVLPWLLGILEHRASDLRRRTQRRRERPADMAVPLAAPASEAPDRAAASAEVLHQVASALESLEPMYREALTLRLVHGLRAVDIARAQGTSPETVRTRIKRGLALLRRCLPKSLARSLVLALLASESLRAGSGLPAVKQTVLQALPAAATWTLGKWLAVAAAVLAAGLAWTLAPWSENAKPTSVPGDARLLVADTARREPSGDATRDAANPMPERREALPGDGGSDATLIRGRVTAAETGLPLAGAKVHVRASMRSSSLPPPDDWPVPADVVTSADGVFEFRLVPRRSIALALDFRMTGRVSDTKDWDSLRNGIIVEVGDVAMEPGTPFQIRVVEAPDRPCPGVDVQVNLANGDGRMRRLEYTDRDGVMTVETAPAGRWHYEVQTQLAGPTSGEFELPLQSATFLRTVVLARRPVAQMISGTVNDTSGAPVADLDLELRILPGGFLPARTGKDGSFFFAINQPPERPDRFRVQLPRERQDLQLVDDGGEIPWGSNDLRLTVRRSAPASLTLTVVDPATGKTVERFGASCRPDLGSFGGQFLLRKTPEEHPGGQVHFDQLPPGPYRICLFPAEPLVDLLERRFELREGEIRTERIELPRRGQLQVQVVDATDRAVAGIELTLGRILPEQNSDEAKPDTFRYTRTGGGSFSGWKAVGVFEIDHAVSDEHGRACLHAATGTPALVLFAGGDRCVPCMVKNVKLDASGPLRIEVETAAVLTGSVHPVEVLRRFGPSELALAQAAQAEKVSWPDPDQFKGRYGSIWLQHTGSNRHTATADLAADGTFRLVAVPAGHYEVVLNLNADGGTREPMADVDLAAGETKAIDLDAGGLLPARVVAHFFVDGVPWHGTVAFAREDSGASSQATADATGTARSPWLLPGTWRPCAQVACDPFVRCVVGTPFVLRPGEEVEMTAALHRRRVTVELLDADGHAAAGRRLVAEPMDCRDFSVWCVGERADDKGVVTFDPAPPGRLRLRALAPDQDPNDLFQHPAAIVLGEIGADDTSMTAHLPK